MALALLWLEFEPWPKNFHMLGKKKKKRDEDSLQVYVPWVLKDLGGGGKRGYFSRSQAKTQKAWDME